MASARRRWLRAIADSEREPERGDAEVAEGLGPHADGELESACAATAGPEPELCREPQQIEAEILEVWPEDVPDGHCEQPIQIGEHRPVPAELGDDRATVTQAAWKVTGKGLV